MSELEEHFAALREVEAREGRSHRHDYHACLTIQAHLSELELAVAWWRAAGSPKTVPAPEAEPSAAGDHPAVVTVPRVPPEELLISMAVRQDHALGLPGYYDQAIFGGEGIGHAARMSIALSEMRKVYEEVVGDGFYRPEFAERYRAMVAPRPAPETPTPADAARSASPRQVVGESSRADLPSGSEPSEGGGEQGPSSASPESDRSAVRTEAPRDLEGGRFWRTMHDAPKDRPIELKMGLGAPVVTVLWGRPSHANWGDRWGCDSDLPEGWVTLTGAALDRRNGEPQAWRPPAENSAGSPAEGRAGTPATDEP